MANFAKLNENNVVVQIDYVNNVVILDENGVEQESIGVNFLRNLYKEPNANWIQTSFNTKLGTHSNGGIPLRMNYASMGGTYDPVKNIFIGTKPHSRYVGPNDNGTWNPPIAYPSITTYTDEQNHEVSWTISLDTENMRWLGSKFSENPSNTHFWNETTSSWDSLS